MFKISPLLLLAPVALTAPLAHAQPAAQPRAPRAAKTVLPAFIVGTYRIAPAPGEAPLLVQRWMAPRVAPSRPGDIGKAAGRPDSPYEKEALSPDVYDIFTGNDKKGWTYQTSFFHPTNVLTSAPTVRYLNNVTKTGYLFHVNGSTPNGDLNYTTYVFPYELEGGGYYTHLLRTVAPSSRGYGVNIGWGRDAKGFAQLITAGQDYDYNTQVSTTTRTVANWDEKARDWVAGQPVTSIKKAANLPSTE